MSQEYVRNRGAQNDFFSKLVSQIANLHIFVALIPNLTSIFHEIQVLASPRPNQVGQNTKNTSRWVLTFYRLFRVVQIHLKSD